MLKHLSLAVICLIAAVCIAEVGLRGHQLYQRCQGDGESGCRLTPHPCPITFQQLEPMVQVARTSSESGQPISIRTNLFGLRGPKITIPKPVGVYRIVCLGDEATMAPDVLEEDTFPALVASLLGERSAQPIEVINAGVPGYCPLLSLAWARQRLASLQPDLVVLCCNLADVADSRRVRPLAKYNPAGQLESVGHPASASQEANVLHAVEQEFQLVALVSRKLRDTLGEDDAADGLPEGWEAPDATAQPPGEIHSRLAWEPIGPLRDLCDQLSADFVVALVPVDPPGGSSPTDAAMQLGTLAEELRIPFLDVTAEFQHPAKSPLFLQPGSGLSTAGHRLFAELLSWAIIHRDGGTATEDDSSSDVMPAGALQPPPSATSTMGSAAAVAAEPSPLPLSRQRRGDAETDGSDWSR